MKYLLVFYFAGFFLADASLITKYKLSLQLKEDEFQGTVTLTLNDISNHEVELDQYMYNVTECTYTGIDFPINPLPDLPETSSTTPTTTTSSTTPTTTTSSTTPTTTTSSATPTTTTSSATPTTTTSSATPTTTTSSATPTTTTSSATPTTGTSSATPTTGTSSATPTTGTSSATPTTTTSSTTPTTTTSSATPTTTTSSATPTTGTSSATPTTGTSSATPTTGTSSATPTTGTSSATPTTGTSSATPTTGTSSATPTTGTSSATPTTGTGLPSQIRSSSKEQTCTYEQNKISFYGNRTSAEVVLKFKGKYQKQGLSSYKTKSGDRFYVADMTAENHEIIFPCQEKVKAQFEFEGDGEVMSNLENLRKKDDKNKIFLRDLTFVQGDIVKDDKSITSFPYYHMKKSGKVGQKLKSVMEKVAQLDPSLKILFTPVEEEIPIIPRDVIILSNVTLKSDDSGSDYTNISRKLVDKWFQRPKETFFDIVGPEFAVMKISGIFDIPSEGKRKFWKLWNIHALEEDGFNNSRSLNELASNNQDFWRNPVLDAKGISVLYSLESICGDEKFMKGLSNYIRDGTSKVNEAFEGCFENKDKAAEFFKVWTDNPGYPVVHVMLNKPAEYNMNQERFLWFGSEQKDRRWIIPIDYETKEGSENSIKLLATKNNVTVTINSTYFILDHNNKGFYRINYDAKLWEALTSQLKSNHSAIDPVSRMKLIDDVFSFPKSIYHYDHGIPDYVTALKLSEYLKSETDFWTLQVAFHALDFLDSALNGSNHGEFRGHMKGILNGIYNKITKVEDPVLQTQVNLMACKFGVEECMKKAMETFRNIKSNATELSLGEKIAICSVVRNDSTKWMDSFALLTAMDTEPFEKNYLLGCSRDEKILSLFLAQFITKNDKEGFKYTVTVVMEHNSDNIKSILNIIKRFEGAITNIFGKEFLQKILRLTFPKLNSESAVTLQEIAKNLDEQFKNDVDAVCKNVKLWTDTKAKSVGEYFKTKGKGSGSQAKPIALVLLMTTLLPLANHIFHS